MWWQIDIDSITPSPPSWDTAQVFLTMEEEKVWNPSFDCKQCQKKFKHKKSLARHIRTNHAMGSYKILACNTSKQQEVSCGQPPSTCQICEKKFITQDKLDKHRDEYVSRLKCCRCGKSLGNRQKLIAHHRTHTKEKPYECYLCEKMFSENSTMRKHLLTHGPRNHSCFHCRKCFVRKDYLIKHLKSNICFQ